MMIIIIIILNNFIIIIISLKKKTFPYYTAVYVIHTTVQSQWPSTLIHWPATNFLTAGHVLSTAAFPIRIYRTGRGLSGLKRTRNLSGIIPCAYYFFFFYWCYNPLWVLAFSVILFHSVLSLHNFLHPLSCAYY